MRNPGSPPLAFLDAMMVQYPHWDDVFALQALNGDRITLCVGQNVMAELSHPMVPQMVRNRAARYLADPVDPDESLICVLGETLAGEAGRPMKYLSDARNLAEATACGARYFLTADKRVLERADQIEEVTECRPARAAHLLEELNASR